MKIEWLSNHQSSLKSWDEWVRGYFDSGAQVCGWDAANKLKWLCVRLSGSKKELYRIELQACKKKQNEGWAVFGEDLAEKAYSDLPEEAR